MTPFTAEQLTQFWQQRYRDATPLPESIIEAGQRCTLSDGSEATLEPTGWYFYDGGVVSTSDRFPEKETLLIINPSELDAIRSTLLEMVDEVHNMRALMSEVRARLDTNDIDLDTLIAACLGETVPPAPAPEQKDNSVTLDLKNEIEYLRFETQAEIARLERRYASAAPQGRHRVYYQPVTVDAKLQPPYDAHFVSLHGTAKLIRRESLRGLELEDGSRVTREMKGSRVVWQFPKGNTRGRPGFLHKVNLRMYRRIIVRGTPPVGAVTLDQLERC